MPDNRMLSKMPSLLGLIRVTGQTLASCKSSLLAYPDCERGVVYSYNADTALLKVERYAACATANIECAAADVFHRLPQVGIPLVEWGEVPPGMFIDLNVAVIALADFTKIFRQQTSVMVVELLSEDIHFPCWVQRTGPEALFVLEIPVEAAG